MTYTQSELEGSTPVFLLEFTWGGRIHRYSTQTISLSSTAGEIQYLGTISQFDYSESMQPVSISSNIVSMALYMQDVDLLQRWSEGDTLDGVYAQFSMVLVKYDTPQQTHEQRYILYTGYIQDPQFGDPQEHESYISISIEAQPYSGDRLLLDSTLVIDERFSQRDQTADGKIWPIVLGSVGQGVLVTASTLKNVYASPAYCTEYYVASTDAHMLIAGHRILSGFVSIQDEKFDTATRPVLLAVDQYGNEYSYITLVNSDKVAIPGTILNGTSRSWWIYLDAGMPSPYGDGPLQLGGDICRWALSRTGTIVDDGAWANASSILNRYKFGGYINDGSITAWEWLNGNILPFLPVSSRMGAHGVRPVINQLWAVSTVKPKYMLRVSDDAESQQLSAVESLRSTSDITNEVIIYWGKSGYDQQYTSTIRVTGITSTSTDVKSEYSILSQSRYGIRPTTIEADYIYDRDTAIRVAMDIVRANCLQLYAVTVSIPQYLSWIEIGDVLQVEITRLHIDTKMLVIEKTWRDGYWEILLHFEINPIQEI